MYTNTHLQRTKSLVSTVVYSFHTVGNRLYGKARRMGVRSYRSQQHATVRVVRRYLNLHFAAT